MASYSVRFDHDAEYEFRAVPFPFRRQINQRLNGLKNEPRPQESERISDSDFHRLRVGAWRVLYEIDEDARLVVILGIRPD